MRKMLIAAALLILAPIAALAQPEALRLATANELVDDQPSATPASGPATPSTGEMPKVPSRLDSADLIAPKSVPVSARPDVVGAFRFVCSPGQLNYDDALFYPGEPGKAHLHQYFGNLEADAHSTYESLRRSGESTCSSDLNRSAYWMPAMLDGKGNVVRPHRADIYYKRRPASDPWFTTSFRKQNKNRPAILPRGLRYVFGWDQTRADRQQPVNQQWKCVDNRTWSAVGTSGDMAHALSQCGPGLTLYASLSTPECWDGKNLDSPNHQSHMAVMVRDRHTSELYCPASHPVVLAQFTLTVEWNIETGDDTRLWHLSSDHMMPPGSPRGASLHSDWFGAWEDDVMERWHAGCIDKLLNCSDGNLGDGAIMRRNKHYPSNSVAPRLVPVPPDPHAGHGA